MTTWHWVRHGPTHQKSFTGWRDVAADLSDQDAIQRLAAHLPDTALVISSDLTRSVDTAHAIQGARTRLPHDPGLREFHFGTWDGQHFSTVADWHPDLSRAYWEDPGDHTPPAAKAGMPRLRAWPPPCAGSRRPIQTPISSLWRISA